MYKTFLLISVLLALAGCRQSALSSATPQQAVQIDLQVEPEPAARGTAALIVTVTGANGALANAPAAVRGDMNHAGMRPVLAEANTDADGVARIPFEWTMGGDWIVTVTVTLADGTQVEQTFAVSVES